MIPASPPPPVRNTNHTGCLLVYWQEVPVIADQRNLTLMLGVWAGSLIVNKTYWGI
ncbi:hypothetical protein PAXRUDRAFT_300794 [Paxillus rubicundulus Ve08.2h10]|uniref:Uncharacterized protein n=1 Tax=Paxillus rubicundulus Ve08.2h10 TaxID=930991 RepID=A0A0D0D5U1_9AGAM|nr:hypothetical protein PAXRUDRAFT_300794 [Paxillus rubicundulus Ve08.2h10]